MCVKLQYVMMIWLGYADLYMQFTSAMKIYGHNRATRFSRSITVCNCGVNYILA